MSESVNRLAFLYLLIINISLLLVGCANSPTRDNSIGMGDLGGKLENLVGTIFSTPSSQFKNLVDAKRYDDAADFYAKHRKDLDQNHKQID